MNVDPPPIVYCLLTEDSGEDAPEILRRLVEKMVLLVRPGTRIKDVHFDPPSPAERRPMDFNGWKEKRNHQKRVDLAQTITTRLLRNPTNVVLMHVDGDRPWSESEGGIRGQNIEAFDQLLRPAIKRIPASREREDCLNRLILIVPYYNVEAWLLQNIDEALALYKRHHPQGHDAVEQLRQFQADRTRLDEVTDLKGRFGLLWKHRVEMVETHWPSRKAHDTNRSFTRAVERLRAVLDVISAP